MELSELITARILPALGELISEGLQLRGSLTLLREPALPPLDTLFLATRAAEFTNPAVAEVHARLLGSAEHG